VLKPDQLRVEPKAGGSAVVTSISPVGYAGMNHFYPYNPEYRWFQVKIADIQGEGYKWLVGSFGDSSGKPGFRMGVHTNRPSTYTLDTHYVNEIFRAGTAKQCYLTVSAAGSGKNADGTGKAGPAFLLDWIQLVRRPQDGLAVTLADGSPLPETLKQGDELLFRLFLDKPALDATAHDQRPDGPATGPRRRQGRHRVGRAGEARPGYRQGGLLQRLPVLLPSGAGRRGDQGHLRGGGAEV
jgi:hypothetical protein